MSGIDRQEERTDDERPKTPGFKVTARAPMAPPVVETGKKIAAPMASGTELIMHRAMEELALTRVRMEGSVRAQTIIGASLSAVRAATSA